MEQQRIFLLQVIYILLKYTDDKHYITYQELGRKIEEKFSIAVNRKTLYSTIRQLMDSDLSEELNYELKLEKKGKDDISRGIALINRPIDLECAKFIIELIRTSRNVDQKSADDLMKSVNSNLSDYQKEELETYDKSYNKSFNRTVNKQVIFTIRTINDAINQHKVITFEYDKNDPELHLEDKSHKYYVSPYYIYVNNGSMFLLASTTRRVKDKDKENLDEIAIKKGYYYIGDLTVYRINKIKDCSIYYYENDGIYYEYQDLKNVPGCQNFKLDEFVNNHIYPYSDLEIKTVKVSFDSIYMANAIKGWFMSNAKIDIDNLEAEITNSQKCLEIWFNSYSASVKIISDDDFSKDLIKKQKERAKNILDKYK